MLIGLEHGITFFSSPIQGLEIYQSIGPLYHRRRYEFQKEKNPCVYIVLGRGDFHCNGITAWMGIVDGYNSVYVPSDTEWSFYCEWGDARIIKIRGDALLKSRLGYKIAVQPDLGF